MDDFNFYLKLAKPLVLNLPDAKDRATAALWLKKLCEVNSHPSENAQDNIQVEYLKLLLLAMQANQLSGIFEKPPPSSDLHELVDGKKKAMDMVSLVKKVTTTEQGEKSIVECYPRVVTSIGGDMCEYVAVQEIPNFGIHGYYAISTEPLSKWSNPRNFETVDTKIPTECFKNTCESLGLHHEKTSEDEHEENSGKKSVTDLDDKPETGGIDVAESLSKKYEQTRHSRKSLQKIFQAQRSEIAGVETRPCWGRSRYIDRLIDETPHLVGDLDLSEADALLHLYRDKKLRKVKSGNRSSEDKTCAISSRRRKVEMMLDMPPCALIPDTDDYVRDEETSEMEGSRTCIPVHLDISDCGIDQDETCGSYHSENEEYYPIESIESLQGYDTSTGNFVDTRYEAELRESANYDNWHDWAYETTDEYIAEDQSTRNERDFYSSKRGTRTNEADNFNDMTRLVEDPNRRQPPSHGTVKRPRRKPKPSAAERSNFGISTWDPPVHSTHIDN